MTHTQQLRRRFFIDVDLGQSRDPSALAIIEQRELSDLAISSRRFGDPPVATLVALQYVVRDLRRFPLRTSYVDVAQSVAAIWNSPSLRVPVICREHTREDDHDTIRESPATWVKRIPEPVLVADATGIGKPVFDHLLSMDIHPVGIILSAGETVHPAAGIGMAVPKRDVVATLGMLFETKRLKLAGTMPLLSTFLKELRAFRLSISASGRDTYGAAGSGHDDLVLSTALALWYAELHASQPQMRVARDDVNVFARSKNTRRHRDMMTRKSQIAGYGDGAFPCARYMVPAWTITVMWSVPISVYVFPMTSR